VVDCGCLEACIISKSMSCRTFQDSVDPSLLAAVCCVCRMASPPVPPSGWPCPRPQLCVCLPPRAPGLASCLAIGHSVPM
jgi:hypothetical protein